MFLKFNVEVLTDGNRITLSSAIAIKQRNPFVNRDDRSYLLVIHNSLMGIRNHYNLILQSEVAPITHTLSARA